MLHETCMFVRIETCVKHASWNVLFFACNMHSIYVKLSLDSNAGLFHWFFNILFAYLIKILFTGLSSEERDEKLSPLENLKSIVGSERLDSELLSGIWKSVHGKLKIMPYVRFFDISKDELTPSDYERLMQLDEHQQPWEPDVRWHVI